MKKSYKIILGFILLFGFLLRLYRLDYPLMDWHSFRQSDTASVTREFVKHNYPVWLPHYQDLGSIQSGLDNLTGYRMVEFPIINYGIAQILRLFPSWDLVVFSRLMAAIFSTISIFLIFKLGQKWQPRVEISLFAAGFFAFLPYSIFYGRAILPEPFQITFSLAALVFFTTYLKRPHFIPWLGTFFTLGVALLIKPTSIFIAPVLLLLAWQKYGWKCLKRIDLYLLAIFAILPLLWWRQFILQFPSGIPASDWLYNNNGIRLRPAWWRWLFYERLTKSWLGYFGLPFFILGLIPEQWQKLKNKFSLTSFDWLSYAFILSMFVYLVIFATGNVQHDYYQVLLLPAVSFIFARGVIWTHQWLIRLGEKVKAAKEKKISSTIVKTTAVVILAIFFSLAWYFGWQDNGGKFNVNNWAQVKIGQTADKILPKEALVIADAFLGDTNFLFQTNRTGWSMSVDLEKKITDGAEYYITSNFDDRFHQLAQIYPVLYQDENGAILDLTKPVTNKIEKEKL